MTLPRLTALNAEWKRCPPARLLIAGYVGYQAPAARKRIQRGAIKRLIGAFGGR